MIEHFVQFYEDDAYLLKQVTGFIRAGLQAGDAIIVIAAKPRRDELETHLRADLARAAAQRPGANHYLTLDAADTLANFALEGRLDERRFDELMEPLVRQAADAANGRVRVFGEMVNLAAANSGHEAAIVLEKLWNNLGKRHVLSILCGYPLRDFPRAADGDAFLRVCNEHSRVGPAESYSPPANAHEHFRAIAVLQQKANALQSEMARRKALEKQMQRH